MCSSAEDLDVLANAAFSEVGVSDTVYCRKQEVATVLDRFQQGESQTHPKG